MAINLETLKIITTVILFFHSFTIFKFASVFFVKRKHATIFMYVFSLLNAVTAYFSLDIKGNVTILSYIILALFFYLEMMFLFKGNPFVVLTLNLGMFLHLVVMRSCVISVFALINEISLYQMTQNLHLFNWSLIVSSTFHIISFALFIMFVPKKYINIIMENVDLLGFICAIIVLVTSYAIFNASVYEIDVYSLPLILQQLILPIVLLLVFYLTFFMTMRIISLHGYEDKTAELENRLDKSRRLEHALLNLAEIVIEVNCTQDKALRILINEREIETTNLPSYSQFIIGLSTQRVHPRDLHSANKIVPKYIINEYYKGNAELTYDCRMLTVSNSSETDMSNVKHQGDYNWYRIKVHSYADDLSNDIIAVFTADNIHEEKEHELALKRKVELDPLTGSFNKETIEKNVSSYLDDELCGALFVFDLDNFKGINDNFGHSYGDEVLREVYQKASLIFRENDFISRIGGDEFVVFMTGVIPIEVVKQKAVNLCKSINSTYTAPNGINVTISTSIGISISPQNAKTYTELFNKADTAMYHSKHKGKNTYTLFDEISDLNQMPVSVSTR